MVDFWVDDCCLLIIWVGVIVVGLIVVVLVVLVGGVGEGRMEEVESVAFCKIM